MLLDPDNTNFYWSKLFYTRFKIWTYTRLWDHVPVALILGIEPYLPICHYGIILGTGHFLRYATTVLFCVQAIFSDLPTTVRCWVQPKLNWDLHSLLASRHRWHMAHWSGLFLAHPPSLLLYIKFKSVVCFANLAAWAIHLYGHRNTINGNQTGNPADYPLIGNPNLGFDKSGFYKPQIRVLVIQGSRLTDLGFNHTSSCSSHSHQWCVLYTH